MVQPYYLRVRTRNAAGTKARVEESVPGMRTDRQIGTRPASTL